METMRYWIKIVGENDTGENAHTEYPSFAREWLMIEAYASFQTSRNSGSPSMVSICRLRDGNAAYH
jgi:hypothetical protein